MKINDNDIKKMLAELPEIELPEGFHDEVMQKVRAEAKMPGAERPKAKKKSRAMWYIGSLATVAAAVLIMVILPDFGADFTADAEPAPVAMATPAPAPAPPGEVMTGAGAAEEAEAEPEVLGDMVAAAPFAVEAPLARMDERLQLWSNDHDLYYGALEMEADFNLYDWAEAVFSLLSQPEGRYALNIGIVIRPYDMAYAQNRLLELSGFDDAAMLLSTDFDNFPEVFMSLLALGELADFNMRPTGIWEGEDVIFITLLHNRP